MRTLHAGFCEKRLNLADCQGMTYIVGLRHVMARCVGHRGSVTGGRLWSCQLSPRLFVRGKGPLIIR
jgi:hypothetical protein